MCLVHTNCRIIARMSITNRDCLPCPAWTIHALITYRSSLRRSAVRAFPAYSISASHLSYQPIIIVTCIKTSFGVKSARRRANCFLNFTIRESIHSSHNMRVALNCGAHSSRSRALWDWVPALDYALRIGLVRGFSQV